MAMTSECREGDYVLRLISARTWMAVAPCLEDSRMSPVGYGRTEQEAIRDLAGRPEFHTYLKRSGRPQPTLADFTIDQQAIRTGEVREKEAPDHGARGFNREASNVTH